MRRRIAVAKNHKEAAVKMAHGFRVERESAKVVALTFDVATLTDGESFTATIRVTPEHGISISKAILRQASMGGAE